MEMKSLLLKIRVGSPLRKYCVSSSVFPVYYSDDCFDFQSILTH